MSLYARRSLELMAVLVLIKICGPSLEAKYNAEGEGRPPIPPPTAVIVSSSEAKDVAMLWHHSF